MTAAAVLRPALHGRVRRELPVTVRLRDGSELPATADAPVVTVSHHRALRRLLGRRMIADRPTPARRANSTPTAIRTTFRRCCNGSSPAWTWPRRAPATAWGCVARLCAWAWSGRALGRGWGSLAPHAARHRGAHVTAVTLCRRRHTHVRGDVDRWGRDDRVRVPLQEYRDIPEPRYGAISESTPHRASHGSAAATGAGA